MILAWTGHRPDLFSNPEHARAALSETARELLRQHTVERFLVGGQRGVDTWAAQTAIDLGIPFTLLLPLAVDDFTADWSAPDRQQLIEHVARADQVRISGGYSERNRQLAAGCDLLVAVWTGRSGGGTAETLAFASELGAPVREVRLAAASGTGSVAGRGI
jgi:YspA SLOG family